VAIAVRRTALDKTILYPSCKRTWLKTAVQTAPNESESPAKNRGSYLIGENRRWRSRSGACRRTALDKTILYRIVTLTLKTRDSDFEKSIVTLKNLSSTCTAATARGVRFITHESQVYCPRISVRRMPLDKMLLYSSCTRIKLKTAVRTNQNSSDRSQIIWPITESARTDSGDCGPEDAT
jgi:hypothetical protein